MTKRLILFLVATLCPLVTLLAQEAQELYDYDLYDEDYVLITDSDRVMLSKTGLVFDVGMQVALNKSMHGFGVSLQAGWRFIPQFAAGLGLMPGIQASSLSNISTTVAANGQALMTQHSAIEENYFALPLYAHFTYELLQRHISPLFHLRVGTILTTADGAQSDFYMHAHIGCRVALLTTNVTPFVGYTTIGTDDEEQHMLAFGVGITF